MAGERPSERWVVIAGGSGGLGRAITRVLAADGWNLVILYHRGADSAEKLRDEVAARHGVGGVTASVDLTDVSAVDAAIEDIATTRAVAGLVYAAGPHVTMDYVSELEADVFARALDVDARGFFHLVKACLPHLRANEGRVLALSTAASTRYAKRDVLSTAPKAVVESLVRAVAVEEGRHGVRANALRVGLIEGEGMWESLHDHGDYDDRWLAAARRNIPLGRFGEVEDVAAAARFLMSDDARWISGQMLAVDGGYSA